MVALLTVGRAQSLLFAELAADGDDAARRAFDRVGRDFAGHAALAFLELRRGTFIDAETARCSLDRMLPATRTLLAGTGLAARFETHAPPLAGVARTWEPRASECLHVDAASWPVGPEFRGRRRGLPARLCSYSVKRGSVLLLLRPVLLPPPLCHPGRDG